MAPTSGTATSFGCAHQRVERAELPREQLSGLFAYLTDAEGKNEAREVISTAFVDGGKQIFRRLCPLVPE